jgi:DTW domain-containing protein YfiP
MNTHTLKRHYCDRCQRPIRTCFCAFIQQVSNRVELLILQHPDEASNVKNTAGLLHLSLKNSHIYHGEQFNEQQLKKIISSDQRQSLLLYPTLPDYPSLGISSPPTLTPTMPPTASDLAHHSVESVELLRPVEQLRLVVIDATWRKSRKMLYLNPCLQQLPLLSLSDTPASIYKIRKAHSQNQLSTLEASCYALQQLEAHSVNYEPVLQAMRNFIAQLAAFIPPSHLNSAE